jgi:ABC-type ATPase involved in cell division
LIAAALSADFATLDRFLFKKITITLRSRDEIKGKNGFIEVEKTEQKNTPFPSIVFRIKKQNESQKEYLLDVIEREQIIRFPNDQPTIQRITRRSGQFERDIHFALRQIVNVSWLSIHRTNTPYKNREERNFESTIDQKILELSNDLIRYLSVLNKRYADETQKFQKYIFQSLIDTESQEDIFTSIQHLDPEKEKESLKQIFLRFGIIERSFTHKLSTFFDSFNLAVQKFNSTNAIQLNDLAVLWGTKRIHSVIQEWNNLLDIQKNINKPRTIFLEVINSLLQRKKLVINERNELIVETQSGKHLPLISLSSGEKQLLIILGLSLLQDSMIHIYIADEPELSLHVEWQEKLVKSLKSVNPKSQIIFATHSPDIVGEYDHCVIKVEDAIKNESF